LGTLANVPAPSGYGPKDFQRIGSRTDLGRYRNVCGSKTSAKLLCNRIVGHSREDAADWAVEVEQQVTGAADDPLERRIWVLRRGHGLRPTVFHTVSNHVRACSTYWLAIDAESSSMA
jgi:hypothetical protein